MNRYVLETVDGLYYSGGAGQNWLTPDINRAWSWTNYRTARQRQIFFNANNVLHGKRFNLLVL